jgi:hypothetical protein
MAARTVRARTLPARATDIRRLMFSDARVPLASLGGLLCGAVCNQVPELIDAALPECVSIRQAGLCGRRDQSLTVRSPPYSVGVMDLLRFHLFTMGSLWTAEYGSPDVEDEFAALRKISPLHSQFERRRRACFMRLELTLWPSCELDRRDDVARLPADAPDDGRARLACHPGPLAQVSCYLTRFAESSRAVCAPCSRILTSLRLALTPAVFRQKGRQCPSHVRPFSPNEVAFPIHADGRRALALLQPLPHLHRHRPRRRQDERPDDRRRPRQARLSRARTWSRGCRAAGGNASRARVMSSFRE